jgi:uncharacterized protein
VNGALPYHANARSIELRVRLTPKSSRDQVEGVCDSAEGPAIAARVRAVPSDGEANAALERLIADWLDIAKSSVLLTAGHKSRIKTITISGDAGALAALVARLLAEAYSKTSKK